MMPRDPFEFNKTTAYKLWCMLLPLMSDLSMGDLGQCKELADNLIVGIQHIHSMLWEFDFSSLMPEYNDGCLTNPDNPDGSLSRKTPFELDVLDHSEAAIEVLTHLNANKKVVVTAPTGAGKSTDFIRHLKVHYRTIYLCLPRRILVENHPFKDSPKLFSGCSDNITQGAINITTAGYFAVILPVLGENDLIVLDEFHEMNEDELFISRRYPNQFITITATPNFPCSDEFEVVHLSKARNSKYTVAEYVYNKPNNLFECLVTEITKQVQVGHNKILVIHPSLNVLRKYSNTLSRHLKCNGIKLLHSGDRKLGEEQIILATAIADAGLTIPNLSCVIDTGLSFGSKRHKFLICDSSYNIKEQRKGRTGRTCDGVYIRLNHLYDETPFDTSLSFELNCNQIARHYNKSVKQISNINGYLYRNIPFMYDKLLLQHPNLGLESFLMLYFSLNDLKETKLHYTLLRNGEVRNEFINTIRKMNQMTRTFTPLEIIIQWLNDYEFELQGKRGNDIDRSTFLPFKRDFNDD